MEIINYSFEKHNKIAKNLIKNKISNLDHEIILSNKNISSSFLIFENKQLLALVPLNFEIDKTGYKYGKFFNLSIPGPIFSDDISNKKFKKIIKLILEELNAKCIKEKAKSIKINFSDSINYNTNSQKFFILLENLIKENFTNKSFLGLRINLKDEINELLKKISKGHKSEIKKQSNKKYYFKNYTEGKLKLNEFKEMLTDQIGNKEYIEPMYEMYKKNKVLIVYENKIRNFSCIFSLTDETVGYLVDNDTATNHHSLIYESIKHFKNFNRIKYINFGVIGNLYNTDINFTKKKENISTFKKGFGGEKYLLSVFEKKYF